MKSNMDPDRCLTFHNNLLAACYNAVLHTENKNWFKGTYLYIRLLKEL